MVAYFKTRFRNFSDKTEDNYKYPWSKANPRVTSEFEKDKYRWVIPFDNSQWSGNKGKGKVVAAA
jgi:hypothetical protein